LSKLAGRLARMPQHMVGGRTVNALTNNPYATASQLLVNYLYEYYNRDPDHARFFTSNNLALPAELFHRVGGFDVRLTHAAGEDRDLCARWLEQGFGMSYEPAAVVHHAHDLTLRKFWRQHFHYGRAAFSFYRNAAGAPNWNRRPSICSSSGAPSHKAEGLRRYGWRCWSVCRRRAMQRAITRSESTPAHTDRVHFSTALLNAGCLRGNLWASWFWAP